MAVTLVVAEEVPLESTPEKGAQEEPVHIFDIVKSMKNLPPGMVQVLIITGLTWVCNLWILYSCVNKFHIQGILFTCFVLCFLSVVMVSIHPIRHGLDGP